MPFDDDDMASMRREALQLAIQLPPDQARALYVLRLTKELVSGFLAGKGDGDAQSARPPLRLI